ncbi:pre-mRNA splicing factor component-domain-containing protein [Hyaloraphidium curvatum]|nr:pre-mRNA splicing factor component-domain-containing protein [Hyaloraphidium curvatum]
MKYGKNQWARISSLLVRKTPKQCKARWYEWLDPAIKKTEWSREEDEKLLHLAKLMPTQWRTIAPIVGRTPAQCLDRYQRLLDEAEAKEADGDTGPTGDDVRRLRPGEIDPDPEVKPARPDPVDMDEDEKEMLSEARARLANTQGKKAKRKAREKQLEEARRLATLQKKRELKAAGIDVRIHKKQKGVDYNADIPFQKRAPAGFWAVTDEKAKEADEKQRFRATELQKLDGKRRRDEEEEAKKAAAKKAKEGKGKDEFAAPAPPVRQKADEVFSQRKKLVLPAPQVGQAELEEIVKIGLAGEAAKAAVGGDGASGALLSDYSAVAPSGPLRTPRQSEAVDSVMVEARNLRAMTMAQTPLLGDQLEVTPAHEGGTGYDGITPRRAPVQTPNPLAAQLTPRSGAVGMTPRGGRPGVAATPLRDEMGINELDAMTEGMEDGEQRRRLADMFASLPKPKNDFEIVVPDAEEEKAGVEMADAEEARPGNPEDAGDRARRIAEMEAEAERKELERRSSAVKRGTPRPADLVVLERLLEAADGEVDRAVAEEVVRLVIRDAEEHPVPGQKDVPERLEKYAAVEALADEELAEARALVEEELAKSGPPPAPDADEFERLRLAALGTDGKSAHEAKMDHLETLEKLRARMGREAERAARTEKKLGITLGGYQARATKFRKDVAETWKELEEAGLQLAGFVAMREREEVAVPLRIGALEEEVKKLQAREKALQDTYRAMSERKAELEAEVERARAGRVGINGSHP